MSGFQIACDSHQPPDSKPMPGGTQPDEQNAAQCPMAGLMFSGQNLYVPESSVMLWSDVGQSVWVGQVGQLLGSAYSSRLERPPKLA